MACCGVPVSDKLRDGDGFVAGPVILGVAFVECSRGVRGAVEASYGEGDGGVGNAGIGGVD